MGLKENLKELDRLRRLLAVSREGGAFGEVVRRARLARRLTLDDLAHATGMAKSYLSQIETGYASPPRDEKVRRIAESLGLDAGDLLARAHLTPLPDDAKARLGRMFDATEAVLRRLLDEQGGAAGADEAAAGPEGEARPGVDLDALERSGLLRHLAAADDADIEHPAMALRAVPIINKVAAGQPQEFTDLGYPVGIADEYIAVPAELSDPNAFAVRVWGDSMEPKYHEGDVVVFKPSAPVRSGDDCYVRFAVTGGPSDGASTFKRVFFDSEDAVRLQPLNERHAPVVVKRTDIAGMYRATARYERL